ncbi:PREDICTED: uncharacterized protein LOC107191156 [Dufourea novaeangliae]|uniref:uncharacterized protein LOC107191156 n=1 Tax=Dufourea novaeangliae TaxID=178035 RepID=UPI0007673666|nr:PREDICTED: uncharacterized protein LOC107191156 [Dufourea novaeangliae]
MNQTGAKTVFVVLFLWLTLLSDRVVTAPADGGSSTELGIVCGRNEEPTKCIACIPTCDHPLPLVCHNPPNCQSGCKCKLGFLKDSDGDCVTIIGCIIDNIKNGREWSIADLMKFPQQKNTV